MQFIVSEVILHAQAVNFTAINNCNNATSILKVTLPDI